MADIVRVKRSKAEAKASYDKMSRYYDLMSGRFEKRFRDAGLAMLKVASGEAVLEIGFGTGDAAIQLARSVGESGSVTGIDISDGMRAVASKRLGDAGLASRVSLLIGDAANLPLGDAEFDAIFMSFTLELFDTPEIPVVLGECLRVLRPGGRLCVVAMALDEHPSVMSRLYVWSHKRFPNYVDCRPIPTESMLAQAGFEISAARRLSMWRLPVDAALGTKTVE